MARSSNKKNTQKKKQPSCLDQLEELLLQPKGASIDEMCQATGWQSHSIRGAMAGALKKRGHVVTSGKESGTRRYRIGAAT
jgi:homoserine dehydrogenase